jgi:hypothetical protein
MASIPCAGLLIVGGATAGAPEARAAAPSSTVCRVRAATLTAAGLSG